MSELLKTGILVDSTLDVQTSSLTLSSGHPGSASMSAMKTVPSLLWWGLTQPLSMQSLELVLELYGIHTRFPAPARIQQVTREPGEGH